MPKFKFALERGGKKSLVIFCRQNYRDMEIQLDGNLLGAITNLTELKEGKIFQLPDGTTLHIQSSKKNLYLIRNGKYLPGSLFSSAPSIYIIAALDVILGIITMFLQIEIFEYLGFGVISIAIGLILFVLGILVHYHSLTALILALITQGISVGMLLFMLFPGLLSGYFSSTHDYRFLVSWFITTVISLFYCDVSRYQSNQKIQKIEKESAINHMQFCAQKIAKRPRARLIMPMSSVVIDVAMKYGYESPVSSV